MARVLVLGAGGLLGLNLALEAAKGHEVVGTVHRQVLSGAPFETIQRDLLGVGAVNEVLDHAKPDWVVNCVALADLDRCEAHPKLAHSLNAELAGRVAKACAQRGLRLAHVSTDAVFDGLKGGYVEEDEPNPQSEYARSKLAGEDGVREAHPEAIIARVNFFGWSASGKRSLAEFFFYGLRRGEKMKGLTDRVFSPLLATHLSRVLLHMLAKDLAGIYHVGSSAALSKYDFGVAIAKQFGLDEDLISPAKAAELGYQAQRAPNLTMKVDKLARDLGEAIPDVHVGSELLHAQYEAGYPQRLRAMAGAVLAEEEQA